MKRHRNDLRGESGNDGITNEREEEAQNKYEESGETERSRRRQMLIPPALRLQSWRKGLQTMSLKELYAGLSRPLKHLHCVHMEMEEEEEVVAAASLPGCCVMLTQCIRCKTIFGYSDRTWRKGWNLLEL